eukprot:jgi/Bigna1/136907/aug1.36_g11615
MSEKRLTSEPPGSFGLPLVGMTSKVWSDFVGFVRNAMSQPANRHPEAEKYAHPCPVFKTAVLGCSVAIVTSDRERKEVFAERSGDFTHRGGYHTLLSGSMGESILTDDNPLYVHSVRELFRKALDEKTVECYMPAINAVIDRHINSWNEKCASHSPSVPVYTALKKMYAELIVEVFFGPRPQGIDVKTVIKDCNAIFTGATSFPVSGVGLFSTAYEKGKAASKRLCALFKTHLLNRMASSRIQGAADRAKDGCGKSKIPSSFSSSSSSPASSSSSSNPTSSSRSFRPLLDIVAHQITVFTQRHKEDPCKSAKGPHRNLLDAAAMHLTLFVTGLTSKLLASLSTSFLRILSHKKHGDLLKSVRKEATIAKRITVEYDKGGDVDTEEGEEDKRSKKQSSGKVNIVPYSVLQQLPLLETVCLEIERVFPPVAGASRGTEKADISLCGYKIPKGWSCNHVANRDPSVYNNPNKFAPDRWNKIVYKGEGTEMKDREAGQTASSEKKASTSPSTHSQATDAHVAFGQGKRKCIGTHLALAILKAFFVKISTGSRWQLSKQPEGTTGSEDGHGWRVKWIPVYSPTPDVDISFAPLAFSGMNSYGKPIEQL